MDLKKIDKEWIIVDDMYEALKIFPRGFVKFLMDTSTIIWITKKKKINGINYYGG